MTNTRRKKVDVPTEKELVEMLKVVAKNDPEAQDLSSLPVDLEVNSKTGRWRLVSGDSDLFQKQTRYPTVHHLRAAGKKIPRSIYHSTAVVSPFLLAHWPKMAEGYFVENARSMLKKVEDWGKEVGVEVERRPANTKTRATKSGGR
jgi:hypothetical protein